jgi:hypothetical protein
MQNFLEEVVLCVKERINKNLAHEILVLIAPISERRKKDDEDSLIGYFSTFSGIDSFIACKHGRSFGAENGALVVP